MKINCFLTYLISILNNNWHYLSMKFRHQKKAVKNMMHSNSSARKYSQGRIGSIVGRLSRRGRNLAVRMYRKKGVELGDSSRIPAHMESAGQHAVAKNLWDARNLQRQKEKQKN